MAFGMSWLAGWQLFDLRRHPVLPIWRRLAWWGIGILCIWLAVSVAVQCFHEPLLLKLHSFIDGNITTSQQKYRHSWYLLRSERLLDQLMIWDWRNALLILLVSVGGWACSRLNISSRYPKWWAGLVVLCTFGEQIVFFLLHGLPIPTNRKAAVFIENRSGCPSSAVMWGMEPLSSSIPIMTWIFYVPIIYPHME